MPRPGEGNQKGELFHLAFGDCGYILGIESGAGSEGPAPQLFSTRVRGGQYGPGRKRVPQLVETMVNPFTFIQEVRAEAKKITWPSRRETMVTTGLVIAMVLLASLFFVLVDSVLRFIVKIVIGGGF